MSKEDEKITATEVAALEEAKYQARMRYEMAKALVEGKVSSEVLYHAEIIYQTQKDVFEPF